MVNNHIKISYRQWGTHLGRPVYLFKVENPCGAYVELTNYGAAVVSAVVPDKAGKFGHVILGFPEFQGYLDDSCYLGSTIGRFANRIGGAKFMLDHTVYRLDANDHLNSNHGGFNGFNKRVFNFEIDDDSISFSLLSEDGDGGYPGNLRLKVNYRWTDANDLVITYLAETDKKTVANFTNHAYFNLSGNERKIFDHSITVLAGKVLEVDDEYVPSGMIKPAGDIALSGAAINGYLKGKGLNDCYVLDKRPGDPIKLAAVLTEETSGRKLEVFTTYPGIIVYTGDYLESNAPGHLSKPYQPFDGLCLECQYFPDSPNHPGFPPAVLRPGELYNETIIYKFSVAE